MTPNLPSIHLAIAKAMHPRRDDFFSDPNWPSLPSALQNTQAAYHSELVEPLSIDEMLPKDAQLEHTLGMHMTGDQALDESHHSSPPVKKEEEPSQND
jgi:hypothetical protein